MAGIYIHVPFCKTRCTYCDFYSSTNEMIKQRYVDALCQELLSRTSYLNGKSVDTIYFGGGTPSQLGHNDFKKIFDTIAKGYGEITAKEITLEANPDDLTIEYLDGLKSLPFNRISMGIQTFHDPTLKLLNRRHNAQQAKEAVANCRKAGFHNISIDLMYGLPGETIERWANDLDEALLLEPQHISAYHLIYEEGTVLYKLKETHKIDEVDEDNSLLFFNLLKDRLAQAGYEHYEISNFALPHYHSKHNTSYWQGISYLGCGPSAHSFNGYEREWNVASINEYIVGLENNNRNFENEFLDLDTRYNEYIITGLRTNKGISLKTIEEKFGKAYLDYCLNMAKPWLTDNKLVLENKDLKLSREGIFLSDSVMSDLLIVREE